MDFEEVFTSPFTTPTTCYSARNGTDRFAVGQTISNIVQFATETHVLSVEVMYQKGEEEKEVQVETLSRDIPRDSPRVSCVGYARAKTERDNGKTVEYEAIVLIDPIHVNEDMLFPDEDSPARNLLQPGYPNQMEKDSDVMSLASNADSSPSPLYPGPSQQKKQTTSHHRRVSSTVSALSVTSVTGTVGSSSSKPPTIHHQKNKSEVSTCSSVNSSSDREGGRSQRSNNAAAPKQSNGTGGANDGGEVGKSKASSLSKSQAKQLLLQAKARLVLMKDSRIVSDGKSPDNGSENITETPQASLALLDFRPLSPCLAEWRLRTSSQSKIKAIVGIFVGSADDSVLKCFVPSSSDPRSLTALPLSDEHFSIGSPVMALDFLAVQRPDSDEAICTLAAACQDGTINLINWSDTATEETEIFPCISSQKVIVDGPLVCLKLDYNPFTFLRVTVGSLCGYVCQLWCPEKDEVSSLHWEDPLMVVQDLWNPLLEEEDPVLAVDVRENYVAVGTQMGRCIVYATRDSEKFYPVWYCLLPYSIHGLGIFSRSCYDLGEDGTPPRVLAVTTRRSFHLFKATGGGVKWEHKPSSQQYSADLAGIRLHVILQDIRRINKEEDEKTKMIVSGAIEEILSAVEEIVRPDQQISIEGQCRSDAMNFATSTIHTLLDQVDAQVASPNVLMGLMSDETEQSHTSRGQQLEYSSSEDDYDPDCDPGSVLLSARGDSGLLESIPVDTQEPVPSPTASDDFVIVDTPYEKATDHS